MYFNHGEENNTGLTVNETVKAYLLEGARWGKFIAIFGIVIAGLMLLGGLAVMMAGGAAVAMAGGPAIAPVFLGVIYIAFSLVYLYPMIALLRYSTKIKEAVNTNNGDVLIQASRFLKNHLKSIGIIIIVMIIGYILFFLFFIVMIGTAAIAQ